MTGKGATKPVAVLLHLNVPAEDSANEIVRRIRASLPGPWREDTLAEVEVLAQDDLAPSLMAADWAAFPELPDTWPDRAAQLSHLLMTVARCRAEVSRVSADAFLTSGGTDGQRTQHAKRAATDAQLAYDIAAAQLAAYKLLLEAASRTETGENQ